MRSSNNLENKIPLGTYLRRVQVICSKFQAYSSSVSVPHGFGKSRLFMIFITNFKVQEILCSFRLVFEGNAEIPESSRFRF